MAEDLSVASLEITQGQSKQWTDPKANVYRLGNKLVTDLTSSFRSAASKLPVGELIKDDEFSLFDAVGALEIMDPKMDSGCLEPGETLKETFDVMAEILPEELIGIMDQMLCYEMAWHTGHPLAQTIFGCHYIDKIYLQSAEAKTVEAISYFSRAARSRPISTCHRILRNYCIAVIKCCALGLDMITSSGHYYEEEDFSTHTFGRDFFPNISPDVCSALLIHDLKNLKLGPGWTRDQLNAVELRLNLRHYILAGMCAELGYGTEEGYPPGYWWNLIPIAADKVQTTHHLGKSIPAAFSDKIQRRLASTQPPRPLVQLSLDVAIEKLKHMSLACVEAERIMNVMPDSAEQLRVLLLSFNSRKPEPLTYSRACLIRNTLGETDEVYDLFLKKDLRELVATGDDMLNPVNWTIEAPLNSTVEPSAAYLTAQEIDAFVRVCVQSNGGYADIYRALLSNRCRLRRTLTHVIRVLDEIEKTEAQNLDDFLISKWNIKGRPIKNWVHFHKVRYMMLVVQLGFELEVYHPGELAMMYWYLNIIGIEEDDYLYSMVDTAAKKMTVAARNPLTSPADKVQYIQSSLFLQEAMEHRIAVVNLASALSQLYQLLYYLNLVPYPSEASIVTKGPNRYEARMKPFLHISKPALPDFPTMHGLTHPFGLYDGKKNTEPLKLTDIVSMCDAVEQYALVAERAFKKYKASGPEASLARGAEDWWEKDVNGCLSSVVGVLVAQRKLRTAAVEGKLGTLKADVGMPGKWHDWWIVPVLTHQQ